MSNERDFNYGKLDFAHNSQQHRVTDVFLENKWAFNAASIKAAATKGSKQRLKVASSCLILQLDKLS